MNYHYVYDRESEVFWIQAEGVVTAHEVKEVSGHMLANQEMRNPCRILVDLSEATDFAGTPEDLVAIAQNPGFPPDTRRAIIVRDGPARGYATFFARYTGLRPTGVFTERNEAIRWLLSPQTADSVAG